MMEIGDCISKCRNLKGLMEEEMNHISLALGGELKEEYCQLLREEIEEMKQIERRLFQYEI